MTDDATPLASLGAAVDPWARELFDSRAAMLWNPPGSLDDEGVHGRSVHQVPQTAWYLLALLGRGDAPTAARVLDALLALQYDEPGTPWHGTFARFRESPTPGPSAVEWRDYDPNWRQFVGVSLLLALRHHRGQFERAQVVRIEDAVARAVEGEQAAGRLRWHYTNVALQHAWLLAEAGDRPAGEALAEEVTERWREHRSFPEFNSPTYDGVDLWALALWRGSSSSQRLRGWGAELEAGLWTTIAARFHAELGNIAGPYGRAYGLDLRRYVAKVGLAVAAGGVPAPLPEPPTPAPHCHDLLALPAFALASPTIPHAARTDLETFTGERRVAGTITRWPTRRDSSAWLGETVMIGAEHGDSDWTGWHQFVAGTVHWRRTDGSVGVLRYVPDGPPRGRAEPGLLRIDGPGHLEVHEPEPPGVVHSSRRQVGDPGVTVLEAGPSTLDGLDVVVRPEGAGSVVEVRPRA